VPGDTTELETALTGEVAPEALPPPAEPALRKQQPTLTRRASLTAAASLLDYTVKAGVSLVLTPILVHGLGRSIYGVWEMLGRLGSYMSATDGRPTEALRLVIAQHQNHPDEKLKQRYIGASLAVWAIMLPVILGAGALLAFVLAPKLTKASPEMRGAVSLTVVTIVLTFILSSLAEVPESVLRGMNLGYRRMGLQSSLNIVGGVCAALAVWGGLGIVGLGSAQIVRAAITGIVYWVLVKKFVPWFKAIRPTRAQVKSLLSMSVWLALGDGLAKILLASDVLVLGSVVAPAVVTTYALTSYAARTAIGIHVFTAGAAIPGLGGLMGKGEMGRANKARHELLLLTWLFATIVGGSILLWNHSFVSLWVGSRNYAGPWVDFLIVLACVQTMFIRIESYIIDATLQPKLRVIVAAVAAVLTITMSIVLTRAFGLIGLSIGIITGRLVQTVAYPILVRRCLGTVHGEGNGALRAVQALGVSIVIFGLAAWLGERTVAPNWPLWLAGVALSLPVVALLCLALGTTSDERRALLSRARTLRAKRRPS
jgi:O-antigen/teichoic acid export membrane protein